MAASAQDAFDKHCADIRLLQATPVQKELKLTAAQRQKMNGYATAFRTSAEAIVKSWGGKAPTTPDPKLRAQEIRLKDGVIGVLQPAQLRRLRELSLQAINAPAIGDDRVAARIGLSTAQKTRFRASLASSQRSAAKLQQDNLAPILAKYRAMKPKNEADKKSIQTRFTAEMKAAQTKLQPRLATLSAKASAELRAILTPKQVATFETLKGKPFRAA